MYVLSLGYAYPQVFVRNIKGYTMCQFHQRFMRTFFLRMSFLCLEFGFEPTLEHKICAKNIDEIDHIFSLVLDCQWKWHEWPSNSLPRGTCFFYFTFRVCVRRKSSGTTAQWTIEASWVVDIKIWLFLHAFFFHLSHFLNILVSILPQL